MIKNYSYIISTNVSTFHSKSIKIISKMGNYSYYINALKNVKVWFFSDHKYIVNKFLQTLIVQTMRAQTCNYIFYDHQLLLLKTDTLQWQAMLKTSHNAS